MSLKSKPEFYDPSTWSDELVLMECELFSKWWAELMFVNPEDQLLPCSPEQSLERLAFYQSRLELAEPEAKKRGLI